MYDDRTNLALQVTENLKAFFDEKLLKTSIPRNVRLAEAPSHGKPVALYDPKSRGAEAYRELALEILQRNNLESPEAKRRQAAAAAAASALKSFQITREEEVPLLAIQQRNLGNITPSAKGRTQESSITQTGIQATKWPPHAQWAWPAGQNQTKERNPCPQPQNQNAEP